MNERDNAGMLDTVDEFEVGALEDSRDNFQLCTGIGKKVLPRIR